MRLIAVQLIVVTGCGFQSGAASQGGTGSGDSGVTPIDAHVVDGTPRSADAHHDAPVDADPWTCGPEPATLPTSIMIGGGQTVATLTEITLNDAGQLVVVSPGATLSISLHYAITDTACPMECVDQLEVGFVPTGVRIGCMFDNGVSPTQGAAGTATGLVSPAGATITAPTTPGEYDFHMQFAQDFACDDTSSWYDGLETGGVLAKLCVH